MATKKTRLRSKADKLWYHKYLKPCCEICGKKYPLQAHHFFYKSQYGHLRYSKANHITLCQRCHFILHHQDPKVITDMIIEKRGQDWYNILKDQAKDNPKSYLTIAYYNKVIEELK